MHSFIDQLAEEVWKNHSKELKDICMVFPTRRAGLFFKRSLSGQLTTPSWSPTIFSIQDFILKASDKSIPDSITLIFELYESYRKFFTSEDFARFYPWGELMLKDFDDIDKYLVDSSKVFATVTDLHSIDQEFALDEEDTERLIEFWKNFFDRDPSRLKNEFINTWKHLHGIYSDFRNALQAKGQAYEGLAYRELAENPDRHFKNVADSYSKIIFAGFYALTPSEKAIIQFLTNTGKAEIYWDADAYYADDPLQEAGKFLRNNSLAAPGFKWKQNHFNKSKEIEIAAVPLLVGQAKYAGNIVADLMNEVGFISEKTAVVLPDEKLLFPILYSLPEQLEHVNVTMGYPLRQTPLFNLFESLIALQRNARTDNKNEQSFFFRDVLNILNHPYIRLIADKKIRHWLSGLKQNFIRIPGRILYENGNPEIFALLFIHLPDVKSVFDWFKKILRLLLESMREQDFRFHRIESEFIYHFYTNLIRLEDVMISKEVVEDIEMFWKIFNEIIATVKIPFSGEPLKGLQVMGFLETRVLDFENVIVLSVNEDVLPAAGNSPSFVPFNIRKAFGLPTYEEQHAVSAFHFYRLLQRAKRIFLIHNSETKALTTGERSRFLLQIEHELARKFPDKIQIKHKIIGTHADKTHPGPIQIEKNKAVLNDLSKFLALGEKNPSANLSPSGLNTYISCSLKFYFQYVAGLKEPEEPEEHMEASTFGSVLHKAMYLLYENVKVLDQKSLETIKTRIDECIDQAIHEEFVSVNQLEGKNILFRNIIRELVVRIINSEVSLVPFNIIDLESDVSSLFTIEGNKTVNLKGIIDRVDESEGILRIVDYKTGRVSDKKPENLIDLFTDPVYKEQFQAYYYAFLMSRKMPGRLIKSGLMALQVMNQGIKMLNNGEVISKESFSEFEKHLSALITEIFSESVPFRQTTDESRCMYCPYISICNR